MSEAQEKIALETMMALGQALERELLQKDRGPLLALVMETREEAKAAIVALLDAPPTNAEAIRTLQNEVRIYTRLMDKIKILIQEGRDAERQVAPLDQEEIESLLGLNVERHGAADREPYYRDS